mgnify:CR=1 FL=1
MCILLLLSLMTWSKTAPPTVDSEVKKIMQMMTDQIEKTNQLAKNNRKMLKEAYRHPRVTAADVKNLKKAEIANLKLLEETEKFLKNQKH